MISLPLQLLLASEPSYFYRNCLSFFSTLYGRCGPLSDNLSCRKIHDLLLDIPSVKSRPKVAGFWVSVVGRPINLWASLWRKSLLKWIENNKNDLLWLIIHRAICVRYALRVWGFDIKSDKCAFCSRPGLRQLSIVFICVCARIVFGTSFLRLCLDY